MATASGTSVRGLQNLLVTNSAPSNLVSVLTSNRPTRPFLLYGYYFLFQFENASPFKTYLVQQGRFYSPGLLIRPTVALLGAGFSFGFDVNWNIPGVPWTCTIA